MRHLLLGCASGLCERFGSAGRAFDRSRQGSGRRRDGQMIRGIRKAAATLAVVALMSASLRAQGAQKPLANADVVKMLRRGISEQTILTMMRTHPAKFDVSNQARAAFDRECAALKPASVSAGAWAAEAKSLWDAMTNVVICQQTNGRGGEGACLPSSERNDGNRRAAGGSPQPYAPKSNPSTTTASAEAGADPSKGQRRTDYEPVTVARGVTQDKAFANWANSGQAPEKGSGPGGQAGATAVAPRDGVGAIATPMAIAEHANVYVAQACAKDSSFRILFVSGTSDGKTLTVGPQYTIRGCSFGSAPALKRAAPPVTSRSQSHTASYPSSYNVAVWTSQPFLIIDAKTASWSDNAIVVTFSSRSANHAGPSTAGLVRPGQVLVTRGDGQTTIYGSEGGLYFRLVN